MDRLRVFLYGSINAICFGIGLQEPSPLIVAICSLSTIGLISEVFYDSDK